MLSTISFPTFSSASPQAAEITWLFTAVLVVCAIIFVVVTVWVGYSVVKFRHNGEEGEPDQLQINKNYEITWTIIPALICVLLGWWTVASMFGPRSGEPIREGDPDIVITGAQWWWEVRYPKLGIVTANEIHIPVGRPIQVQLETNDVIHTFWVPDLGRKQQMIPGHHNAIVFQANRVGEFLGACAQYCGNQHAWMRLLLVSESEADFNAWAAAQSRPNPVPALEPAPAPVAARTGLVGQAQWTSKDHTLPGTPTFAPASGAAPAEIGATPGKPAPQSLIDASAKVRATEVDTGSGASPSANSFTAANRTSPDGIKINPEDLAGGSVARGLRLYKEQTCGTCHAIDGVSTARYAPDLGHIASRKTLGAGVIAENTPENLYKWLLDPQAYKPGCNMPNFHFTPEQTRDLVAYLETLK